MSDKSKPAFPVDGGDVANNGIGMTLREYYAGLAMQGMLSTGVVFKSVVRAANQNRITPEQELAFKSVEYADALIAALQEARDD